MSGTPAGGAATAAGMAFQARVTAWLGAQVLLGSAAPRLFGWPRGKSPVLVRAETEQPVDDILVVNQDDDLAFIQVKTSLSLSDDEHGPLGTAIGQFVDQYLACKGLPETAPSGRPWDRRLDPARDRLGLVASADIPRVLRDDLPRLLSNVRRQGSTMALSAIPVNRSQHRCLSVLDTLIRRAWRRLDGRDPQPGELLELLQLTWVVDLDLTDDSADITALKAEMVTTVLSRAHDVDSAWSVLLRAAAEMAATRGGADVAGWRDTLLREGFILRTPPQYARDVARLRAQNVRLQRLLSDLTILRFGAQEIKLSRPSVSQLAQASERQSLLIVGEPGAGKSAALLEFAAGLQAQQRDYILLPADRLNAATLPALQSELGVEHPIDDIIDHWSGDKPAFLLIDGLDAARAEYVAAVLRDLMRLVIQRAPRWRVIASIRQFDLQHSPSLQGLFRLAAPATTLREYSDPSISTVAHFRVPLLSPEETAQLETLAPRLFAAISSAPAAFRSLLRYPFNLRLVADLLGTGMERASLNNARTQLDLLNLYWQWRVMDRNGELRQATLREVCDRMVRARSMRISRKAVDRDGQNDVTDLLSNHVLVVSESDIVAFAHHLLFDYAVARLLFRGLVSDFIERLRADRDLALVVRPSLQMHYEFLWSQADRQEFWQAVLGAIADPSVPRLARLVGPSVLATQAKDVSDLFPMIAALSTQRDAAEELFGYVAGWLLSPPMDAERIAGPQAGPWCPLLEELSRNLSLPLAYRMRPLVWQASQDYAALTAPQQEAIATTASRLVTFAWGQPNSHTNLVTASLQALCRTYRSSPIEGRAVLHRALDPEHVAAEGHNELFSLSQEVEHLLDDPPLVEQVYESAFRFEEERRDPVRLGDSRILSLTTTPRQSVDLARYALVNHYRPFLDASPLNAVRALIDIVDWYVQHRRPGLQQDVKVFDFGFAFQTARVAPDLSYVWDAGDRHRVDHTLKLLDIFSEYLDQLATSPDSQQSLGAIVQLIVERNVYACLWRRLLNSGASHPETLGRLLTSMVTAWPILAMPDTSQPAGELIRSLYPILDEGERSAIEDAILSLDNYLPTEPPELASRYRNRLLGCLQKSLIVLPQTKLALSQIPATGPPPNAPFFQMGDIRYAPYTEEEHLSDQGVVVDDTITALLELIRPLDVFAQQHLNSVPQQDDLARIAGPLQSVYAALQGIGGIAPEAQLLAWGHFVAACSRLARSPSLDASPLLDVVSTGLLIGSRHPVPEPSRSLDEQFDDRPSWGAPAPRVDAAAGLINLTLRAGIDTAAVLDAIGRLSRDPVPAVRFHIVIGLSNLANIDPDLMWRLIEERADQEPMRSIVSAMVVGPVVHLAGEDRNRVKRILRAIYDRLPNNVADAKAACVGAFASMFVWLGDEDAREFLQDIMLFPNHDVTELDNLPFSFRELLTYGPADIRHPDADAVRVRVFWMVETLTEATTAQLRQWETGHRGQQWTDLTESERNWPNELHRLLDSISTDLYLASGAFTAGSNNRPVSDAARRRLYDESRRLIALLTELGSASIAHHLLETLEVFVTYDPPSVFLSIAHVINKAREGLYQHETMGVDLVVKLVERYLAEYRPVLQNDVRCQAALLGIMDTFIEAGWPSAHRLTYRLEEIFR